MRNIVERKRCIKCNEIKHIDLFSNSNRSSDGKTNICLLCHNLSKKEWLKNNPDKHQVRKDKCKAKEQEKRKIVRDAIIKEYGSKCECCGEINVLLLAIDHINGGGRKQRKELKVGGSGIASLLSRKSFPKGEYRLLCHNCNSSHGYYGYCPHGGVCQIREYKNERSYYEHKRRVKARRLVIENYGGKCECCDEDFYEFLTIDHKDNSGASHREEIGINTIYFWLIRNNYPKDRFRLLCHNCNYATAHYGICHATI